MKTIEQLEEIRQNMLGQVHLRVKKQGDTRIAVCMSDCGIDAGAREVLLAFVRELKAKNIVTAVAAPVPCAGLCQLEPIVEIVSGGIKTTYVRVTPEMVTDIVSEHVQLGRPVEAYTIAAASQG